MRATPANHIIHRCGNVARRRVRVCRKQRCGGHDLSVLAISALRHTGIDPGFLHGMQAAVAAGAKVLERNDPATSNIPGHQQAGPLRFAIDMNDASTARAAAASILGAIQMKMVTKQPQQAVFRERGRNICLVAVQRETHAHLLRWSIGYRPPADLNDRAKILVARAPFRRRHGFDFRHFMHLHRFAGRG